MEILSYQDLINNAAKSLNDSQELQQTVTAYGLLQETIQLEYVSSHNILDALNKFDEADTEVIEELSARLTRLAKQKRLKNSIKLGDKVAKGSIAGVQMIEGEYYALIKGTDFNQWQRLDEIEL